MSAKKTVNQNLEKLAHPLFDSRLMYQFLELENTLSLLVKQHEDDGFDTEPYQSLLNSTKNNISLVRSQFSLKSN